MPARQHRPFPDDRSGADCVRFGLCTLPGRGRRFLRLNAALSRTTGAKRREIRDPAPGNRRGAAPCLDQRSPEHARRAGITVSMELRRFLRWIPDHLPLRYAAFQASGKGPEVSRRKHHSLSRRTGAKRREIRDRAQGSRRAAASCLDERSRECGSARPGSLHFGDGASQLFAPCPGPLPLRCAALQPAGKGAAVVACAAESRVGS